MITVQSYNFITWNKYGGWKEKKSSWKNLYLQLRNPKGAGRTLLQNKGELTFAQQHHCKHLFRESIHIPMYTEKCNVYEAPSLSSAHYQCSLVVRVTCQSCLPASFPLRYTALFLRVQLLCSQQVRCRHGTTWNRNSFNSSSSQPD